MFWELFCEHELGVVETGRAFLFCYNLPLFLFISSGWRQGKGVGEGGEGG